MALTSTDYFASLAPPDLQAARATVAAALDQGADPATLVDDVLVPAQVEVGRRWQVNEWTVAQEHAATAVTDAVLAELAIRGPHAASTAGRLVTGCVEGEWHTMPIRMVNLHLTRAGYDVTALGPSLPPPQLPQFLHELEPRALVVNCTLATNLAGARRTIRSAHQAATPVIVGGRAFGADATRGEHIGADAWAPTAEAADEILQSWASSPPVLRTDSETDPTQGELERPRPGLVDDCLYELLQRCPTLQNMSHAQLTHSRDDIERILQFTSAAMLTKDQSVLDQFTTWMADLLAARGIPALTIAVSYEAIADVLGAGFPTAISMLTRSAAQL